MLDLLVLSTFIFIRQIILCICDVNIFTQRQEGLTAVSFFLEKYFIKYQIHCISIWCSNSRIDTAILLFKGSVCKVLKLWDSIVLSAKIDGSFFHFSWHLLKLQKLIWWNKEMEEPNVASADVDMNIYFMLLVVGM